MHYPGFHDPGIFLFANNGIIVFNEDRLEKNIDSIANNSSYGFRGYVNYNITGETPG